MKKLVSIVISLAVLVSIFVFPLNASAESIEDTAQSIKSGQTVSGYSTPHVSDDYAIKVAGKGKLTIDLSHNSNYASFSVYDENGVVQSYIDASATRGSVGFIYGSYGASGGLQWNETIEKAEGTFVFSVKKGTYYIKLWTNGGDFKMTVTDSSAKSESKDSSSKSSSTDKTTSAIMTVELKKGSSLQLGADLPRNEKVTWKSSKTSVATVSSSGKVTAVASGSATITATAGKTLLKIKVIVK